MKFVELQQGSAEWHAHRLAHFNASDAPAMLGISPYKTRDELLREKATGLTPEIDEATQNRFDEGHRFELLARQLTEEILNTELFPCVGVLEDTKLSASFDGITMDEQIVWEHKTLNATLRSAELSTDLPEHYRAQMEQQLLVSGADKVIFMASSWDDDDNLITRVEWFYHSDPTLRQRIIDGWVQFERDLAEYQPEPLPAPKPAGRAPELLPALHVQVQGSVVASNVAEFKQQAFSVLNAINRDLQTDEDFANAESTIKWCKQAEQKISATKDQVQGQMADVDAVQRALDEVSAYARNIRLELDKLVKVEKENRKLELVQAAANAARTHVARLNESLDEYALGVPAEWASRIGESIKGLRLLASMQDAINTTLAALKSEADADALRIQTNRALMQEYRQHGHLFPDAVVLCRSKQPEDLKNLAAARVAAHEQKERERLDAERERIRQEEAAKARAEAEAKLRAEQQERERQERERERIRAEEAAKLEREKQPSQGKETAATLPYENGKVREVTLAHDDYQPKNDALIKLGEINAAIAPLSISADGLAQLGCVHVATDKAARLYRAADFPHIRQKLIERLAIAQLASIDHQRRDVEVTHAA